MVWRNTWTNPGTWETALEMAQSGEGWASIGKVVGCSPAAVRRKFYSEGTVNGLKGSKRLTIIWIEHDTYRVLNESASARGKGVGEMMSDVANIMADSVLLENVLDDGVSI